MRTRYLVNAGCMNRGGQAGYLICREAVVGDLKHMFQMAETNISDAFEAMMEGDRGKSADVLKREQYVDYLNEETCRSILRLSEQKALQGRRRMISTMLSLAENIQNISGVAVRMCRLADSETDEGNFSQPTIKEIAEMKEQCMDMLELMIEEKPKAQRWYRQICMQQYTMEEKHEIYMQNMSRRIHRQICTREEGVRYGKLLQCFGQIAVTSIRIADGIHVITNDEEQSAG